MTVRFSIFLAVVGAVLRYALRWRIAEIDLGVLGLILMITGITTFGLQVARSLATLALWHASRPGGSGPFGLARDGRNDLVSRRPAGLDARDDANHDHEWADQLPWTDQPAWANQPDWSGRDQPGPPPDEYAADPPPDEYAADPPPGFPLTGPRLR